MSSPVALPSFCTAHWGLLRVHQTDEHLALATVRAMQFGTQKFADERGWGPTNVHDVSEVGPIVGPCWVCYFGVGFLNELDDFIAHPPDWASAQAKPSG